jgi:Rrf2 family protein
VRALGLRLRPELTGGAVLGIKRETDYAVRVLLHLASLPSGTQVQVKDVAAHRLLPLSFVRRIVARLRAVGLLETTRGIGGGVVLARPASQISLLDVVNAMDDPVTLNQCLDPDHTCPLAVACPAHVAWAEATEMLETHLASVRFDALAGSGRHAGAHRRLARTNARRSQRRHE